MKTRTILFALLAAGTITAVAHADSVSVEFSGIEDNYGKNIEIKLSGGLEFANGKTEVHGWAGQLTHTINGVEYQTYCTELTQWAGSGEFDIVDVADAPNPGPNMGQEKADAIYRLFNATNNGQDIESDKEAAAFQAVIWDIVYDFGTEGFGLSDGRVSFHGIKHRLFDRYKNFAIDPEGDTTPRIVAYSNPEYQDQLGITSVPLPGSAVMAALGIGCLGIRRRRQA